MNKKVMILALSLAMAITMAVPAFAGVRSAKTNASATDSSAVELLSGIKPTITPTAPTKAAKVAFIKSSADFSINLFKKSASGRKSNTMIAPMSVLTAMSMTANGAKSATRTEMRNVLAGKETIYSLNRGIYWWTHSLSSTDSASIKTANSIWYRDSSDLSVNQSFLQRNANYYGAQIYKADFAQQDQVLPAINGWVNDNTSGMIKKVLSSISNDDDMFLINAVAFDAKWSVPYAEDSVRTGTFTKEDGTTQKVTMMSDSEYQYISGSKVTGFIKPYKKGYSFVALLPREGNTVSDCISSMTGASFRNLIKNAKTTEVLTMMPKFKSTYSADMRSALMSMGIKDAFDGNNADLTGIGTFKDANLYISKVTHKTYIQVDEAGTKAGAVTSVGVANTTSIGEQPPEVYLNRPFIYAIVDNSSKLPVFIGTEMSVN